MTILESVLHYTESHERRSIVYFHVYIRAPSNLRIDISEFLFTIKDLIL